MNKIATITIGIFTLFFSILQINAQSTSGSTASENVKILEHEIFVPYSGTYRTLRIYLPPSYGKLDKRYPVIYMLDGQNLFDDRTSYVGEWGVDETLDKFISEGKQEVIVVGIDNHSVFRMQEYNIYNHPDFGPQFGEIFIQFLVENLKKYIDEKYLTLSDRSNTAIIGSSMGGLMAFYSIIKYPEIFSKAGVYSPSFWVSDKIFELHQQNKKLNDIKIHMIVGSNEGANMVMNFEKMESILKSEYSDENLKIEEVKGQGHSETFWKMYFPESYLWFFN